MICASKQEAHGALRRSHDYNVILMKVPLTGPQVVLSEHISKVNCPNGPSYKVLSK